MIRVAALALLVLVPSSARAQCEVTGVASIERLRVRIPGEPLRTFGVTDVPLAVRPGRGSTYRDVRVLAPITFAARTDAPIPWTVPRPGELADGMLWLTPAVDIEDVREEGDGETLVVRAQIDNGVWISRLHVPCGAIAIGHGEGGAGSPPWSAAHGPRWQPRGDDLYLSSEPNDDGATVRLDAPDGLAVPLVELGRRDGWVRLAASFGSGAVVRGWALAHHLRPAPRAVDDPDEFRRSHDLGRVPLCRRGPPARNEYVGPANIATGALVHLTPDGAPWASVSEPAVFTVSWETGSEWVRIVHVPGVRGDGSCPEVLRRAWVPRRAVSLQGEGSNVGGLPNTILGID